MYGIDYSGYNSNDRKERIKAITKVANEILTENDETQQKFCDVVTQMQKVFALVSIFFRSQRYFF
ncbi:hypothetical protein J2Z60_002070 [Lactobacillus colini]|uniref:Type I restriction enzyme HindI endonuclease subunit-like C-terminal domain-containing protein n=1 Tax=Lactobacillus colini TaxID=1819254 RepID=A0ABS4MHQ3_9LACO|nr:type I restriction enzyme endonuclease domain-containing protein [Lactobacillus colini]MBP2058879.1 hypothetical protein [Lactobacillus colini]